MAQELSGRRVAVLATDKSTSYRVERTLDEGGRHVGAARREPRGYQRSWISGRISSS